MDRKHRNTKWKQTPPPKCDQSVLDENSIKITGVFQKRANVSGHCPYCLGAVTITKDLNLLAARSEATTGQAGGQKKLLVTVQCNCGHSHRGSPDGTLGCGQLWVAEAVK